MREVRKRGRRRADDLCRRQQQIHRVRGADDPGEDRRRTRRLHRGPLPQHRPHPHGAAGAGAADRHPRRPPLQFAHRGAGASARDAVGGISVKLRRTGITESLKIIALCEAAGIPMVIGTDSESRIGAMPRVHLRDGDPEPRRMRRSRRISSTSSRATSLPAISPSRTAPSRRPMRPASAPPSTGGCWRSLRF